MDEMEKWIEEYWEKGLNKMEDGIEVEGIRIVFEKMKKEYENGGDIEESENMMEEDEMGEKELKKGIGEIN